MITMKIYRKTWTAEDLAVEKVDNQDYAYRHELMKELELENGKDPMQAFEELVDADDYVQVEEVAYHGMAWNGTEVVFDQYFGNW